VTATCARDRSDEGGAEPNGGTSEDGAAQQLTDVRTAARDGATRRLQTAVEARRGGRSEHTMSGNGMGALSSTLTRATRRCPARPVGEKMPRRAAPLPEMANGRRKAWEGAWKGELLGTGVLS
jgi:hypothetical protein